MSPAENVLRALIDAGREHRVVSTIIVVIFCGLIWNALLSHYASKPGHESPKTESVTQTTTINQRSGHDSPCTNIVSSGNGSVTCSSENQEEKPHDQGVKHGKTP